jgi:prolyl 4-hydroxylase
MKGGGVIRAAGGGAGGAGLLRTRLRLPVVLLSCSLFFLAGFFGSLLFTQVRDGEPRATFRFVASL